MRLTIERIRTLVLAAAALLLIALGVFLATARARNRLHRTDAPQPLAGEISQQSQNFDYTHNFGAHSRFRIHAIQAIQLKNDRTELRGVEIKIYGEDGAPADKITGGAFEFNQKSGVATAAGPVEMLLSQPQETAARHGDKSIDAAAAKAHSAATRQIRVETSGVSFDRNSGLVTTAARVRFAMTAGTGSAVGASFDSQNGFLKLMQAVEIATHRGGEPVEIRAAHAEFDRDAHLGQLRNATLRFRDGEANSGQARILFRDDGSAAHLDAAGGFLLTTATGGRLASATATMDFDTHNQPQRGRLEGGVTMDSSAAGRTAHGTAATADLTFDAQGQLRQAHLEREVRFASDTMVAASTGIESRGIAQNGPEHIERNWRSPAADVEFRTVVSQGKTQLEPARLRGADGVTVTSQTLQGRAVENSTRMSADAMTGEFDVGAALRALTGTGHATIEQTTSTGAQQTANGDRLTAELTPAHQTPATPSRRNAETEASGVQSAEIDGHVTLFDAPAPKPGEQPQPPLRATAGRATYEDDGQWLHLSDHPRIVEGGMELAANTVDLARQSGEAFARGGVKATWAGDEANGSTAQRADAWNQAALGGNGPAHVIADAAEFSQTTGAAIFHGHARLWQQANSVAAPQITLDQHQQTLTAHTNAAGDPVRLVLLNAGSRETEDTHGQNAAKHTADRSSMEVIRVRGGDLFYSEAERRATMRGGVMGKVTAATASAQSTSDRVELLLTPAGSANHGPARDGQTQFSQAQVDRLTAVGHVVLTAQDRRGTGEQLVYTGATGDYVLTGTPAAPPRLTDPDRGSVTGKVLIFHSRDDSVSIEGGGGTTHTASIPRQGHGK